MMIDPYNPTKAMRITERSMFVKATSKYINVVGNQDMDSRKCWIQNKVMELANLFEKPPVMMARAWHDWITKVLNEAFYQDRIAKALSYGDETVLGMGKINTANDLRHQLALMVYGKSKAA